MSTPWIDSVRRGRILHVFKDDSMDGGVWNGVFERALPEFNELARANSFGVAMVASSERPARRGLGGAEVMVAAASGQVTLPYDEAGARTPFDVPDVLHGKTRKVLRRAAGLGGHRIAKCFVYLPSRPMVQVTPSRSGVPGPGVLMTVLVHEFVHCCGLSDGDHQVGNGSRGVFRFPFAYLQDIGSGEGIDEGGYQNNLATRMPPIVIDDQSPERIRPLWEAPPVAAPAPDSAASQGAALQGRGPLGRDNRFASLDSPGETPPPLSGHSRGGRAPGPLGNSDMA